jgi:hypothetical protein
MLSNTVNLFIIVPPFFTSYYKSANEILPDDDSIDLHSPAKGEGIPDKQRCPAARKISYGIVQDDV